MADPDHLRVAAIDEEDLAVVSAYVQDSVLKVGDMIYLPAEHRFALAMNRFIWEKAIDGKRPDYERRRAALTFDRVLKVQTAGIDRDRPDAVLNFSLSASPSRIIRRYRRADLRRWRRRPPIRRGHRGAPRRYRRRLGNPRQALTTTRRTRASRV